VSETLTGAVAALADLLAIANPDAFGRASRLRRISSKIAIQLQMPDAWEVEVAAVLSQLGAIALPRDVVRRALRGDTLTPPEISQYHGQYRVAGDLIARIPRLESVAAIVRGLGDNPAPRNVWGAKGPAPGGLATDVVRVALEVDRLTLLGRSSQEAVSLTAARRDLADERVLDALRRIGLSDTPRSQPSPWDFAA
jgi:hypothetical protein